MMMEQNARGGDGTEFQNAKRLADTPQNSTRNQMEPGNDDGTQCQAGDTPRNPTRNQPNQKMMMEQNPKRLGRQAPEPYSEPDTRNQKEPGNDDGTECQKTSRHAPELYSEPDTRNQKEPGNDDGTQCEKSRETSPGTVPRTRRSRWNKDCFLEEVKTPFNSRAVW